jgi:hypothetical protein
MDSKDLARYIKDDELTILILLIKHNHLEPKKTETGGAKNLTSGFKDESPQYRVDL